MIVVAVRWYLRFSLSYRDVEELLAERGVEVDHVTVFRWVQRFTPLLADAARFARHAPGDRWFVDETYVKVNGVWRYVYRAVDQYGQVIDVLVSARRDAAAARRFFRGRCHVEGDTGRGGHRRRPDLPGRARRAGRRRRGITSNDMPTTSGRSGCRVTAPALAPPPDDEPAAGPTPQPTRPAFATMNTMPTRQLRLGRRSRGYVGDIAVVRPHRRRVVGLHRPDAREKPVPAPLPTCRSG